MSVLRIINKALPPTIPMHAVKRILTIRGSLALAAASVTITAGLRHRLAIKMTPCFLIFLGMGQRQPLVSLPPFDAAISDQTPLRVAIHRWSSALPVRLLGYEYSGLSVLGMYGTAHSVEPLRRGLKYATGKHGLTLP